MAELNRLDSVACAQSIRNGLSSRLPAFVCSVAHVTYIYLILINIHNECCIDNNYPRTTSNSILHRIQHGTYTSTSKKKTPNIQPSKPRHLKSPHPPTSKSTNTSHPPNHLPPPFTPPQKVSSSSSNPPIFRLAVSALVFGYINLARSCSSLDNL